MPGHIVSRTVFRRLTRGHVRIITRATITHANDTALGAYAQPTPRVAITSPPIAGPATEANWNMIAFKVMAFGRCSRGTSMGTRACRAGRSKVLTAAPSAASA